MWSLGFAPLPAVDIQHAPQPVGAITSWHQFTLKSFIEVITARLYHQQQVIQSDWTSTPVMFIPLI